jgi:hypothetical protein
MMTPLLNLWALQLYISLEPADSPCQLVTNRVAVEKLAPRNHAQKHRARTPYKRFSPAAYTFLVTDFDLVFRRIDFFNTHRPMRSSTHSERIVANCDL